MPLPAILDTDYLGILRANAGFGDDAERWVTYARDHDFQRVSSRERNECPDCRRAISRTIGQYIYYSTLIRLHECARCGLWYSSCVLDDRIVARHFATAYKDETYFARHRRPVFEQLSTLIDRHAPRDGSVLDIGGAKGHLMAMVRERRPDLQLTVSDLSSEACEWAHRTFGFDTVPGRIADLVRLGRQHDVVVLSDVIYYEPDPRPLWRVITALVRNGGAVIVRAPNTASLVRGAAAIQRLMGKNARLLADRVRFFNPEHTLLFPRDVLARRLRAIGFGDIRIYPGRFGASGWKAYVEPLAHRISSGIARASGGRLVLSPSYVLVAVRHPAPIRRRPARRPRPQRRSRAARRSRSPTA